jgi:2-oxoglutarate ferredoxin oxidoreductase subunit alpha
MNAKPVEELDRVAIRFAGDSGDGMQLTGTKFTESTAIAGNDLSTLMDIKTPADHPDVLVAMNPAALRANVEDVRPGGMIIINVDVFNKRNLERAGYTGDPLPDLHDRFRVVEVPLTKLTRAALEDFDISQREADRCKNFFALGMMKPTAARTSSRWA